MIEELKLITEIFKNATDGALYAYISYIVFSLSKTCIWVFTSANVIKFIINKVVIDENSKNS